MAPPETRYARNGDLHIAYQLVGRSSRRDGRERDGTSVLVANLASSVMAMVFAATYPVRVRALALVNAYPRFTRAADYPWGPDIDQIDVLVERTRRTWGKGMLLRQFAPSGRAR